jgi:hypothetical protein
MKAQLPLADMKEAVNCGGLTFRSGGFSKTRRSDQSGWLADSS